MLVQEVRGWLKESRWHIFILVIETISNKEDLRH